MRRILVALVFGAASLLPLGASFAKELPVARAEAVGMSTERLARVTDWLRAEAAANRIPGAILAVARDGKIVRFDAVGKLGPNADTPMPRDALFRIYSMTKPIASVAAMMLVEEGKLTLDAPVSRFIPSFAQVKVLVEKADGNGGKPVQELVAPRRAVTVQDLMRHTSGLTYGFFGDNAVKRMYNDAKIDAGADITNAEFAEKIATMPLGAHPGASWDYSYSTDVLGRVIEVAAGKPLGQFLRERLFEPLGMKDTAFYVTDPAKQARLAEPLANDRAIGAGIEISDPRVALKSEPAGQGLVSTAGDYLRFAQMLANGGELDGRRYLGPKTLEFMTSDHLGSAIAKGPLYLPGPGYGFGLGFAVRTAGGEAAFPASVGEYWWGGAGGTYFWVDPKSKLVVVFMMQSPKQRVGYRTLLRDMVNAAIVR